MSPAIKICGICSITDAKTAVDCGVEYIGLIFVPSSPRYIDLAVARSIVGSIGDQTKIVGVFRNANAVDMENIASEVRLDYFQLHGSESPALCASLSKPVIKSVDIGPADQMFDILTQYRSYCRHFLFDRAKEHASIIPTRVNASSQSNSVDRHNSNTLSGYGSSLSKYDNVLSKYNSPLRENAAIVRVDSTHDAWLNYAISQLELIEDCLGDYFFAGGLNATNIEYVLQRLKPAVVDVASSIEKNVREKSKDLIADFCVSMRNARITDDSIRKNEGESQMLSTLLEANTTLLRADAK